MQELLTEILPDKVEPPQPQLLTEVLPVTEFELKTKPKRTRTYNLEIVNDGGCSACSC
jgi:hypothetical protein